eukprot:scaffold132034_cov51-Phaeocystis_antarctica.AAC.2
MRAEQEPQPPSRMPAALYGIRVTDTEQLAALHPGPRAQVLSLTLTLTLALTPGPRAQVLSLTRTLTLALTPGPRAQVLRPHLLWLYLLVLYSLRCCGHPIGLTVATHTLTMAVLTMAILTISKVLRLLDYPTRFAAAELNGLELPPLEDVASMEPSRLHGFWSAALLADRTATACAPASVPVRLTISTLAAGAGTPGEAGPS